MAKPNEEYSTIPLADFIGNVTPGDADNTQNKIKTNTATPVQVPPSDTKPARKKYDKNSLIPCRSITAGALYLDGVKSKIPYLWVNYGDVTDVEYQDLAVMVRSKGNSYIYGPLFVIEDDDFIDEFPMLRKFYDEQYTVRDLENVLRLPVDDMRRTIIDLPNGAKESLKNIASTQVVQGVLDSVKKIKVLDELFGTELNLLATVMS